MKSKTLKKIAISLAVFAIWIAIWWIAAIVVFNKYGDNYFLPSPLDTLLALINLLKKPSFYRVVFASLLRVIAGLLFGTVVGTALAFICHKVDFLRSLFSPVISVLKAMPVATFILLLWITVKGSSLTILIGVIMVLPIIFQNVLSGLDSIDKNLLEVTKVYGFSLYKRMKILVFPSLRSYLFPAIITSVGLAFKSQIAAEIIAYTNNSIGGFIYDANYALKTDEVFAWAAVIVVFSIALETICKKLLGRVKK